MEGVAIPGRSVSSVKRTALIASILGSGIVFLDGTIVNVALPAIRSDLSGTLADQQWVVEAYLLTLGSLLLVGGSLGDLYGRRRIFSIGLIGFGACSLLCAVAPDTEFLIFARGAQGIAGALLVPSTLALIMDTFGEDERAAAIGTWTAWTGVATVIGPLGGGALIQFASWRWIFAINLIPVAITLFLLTRLEPDHRTPGHVDVIGAILCALGLGGPVFALIEQPQYGWGDPRVFIPLIGGIVLFIAFLLWERHDPRADDAPWPVQDPQLRRGQPDDVHAVFGTRNRDVLPDPVRPAGGRLHPNRGGAVAAAGDDHDVPARSPIRSAGGSDRPARVHGRRADGRRPWACCCSSAPTRARTI